MHHLQSENASLVSCIRERSDNSIMKPFSKVTENTADLQIIIWSKNSNFIFNTDTQKLLPSYVLHSTDFVER